MAIRITIENGDLIVKTPYSREFVDDLKQTIPRHGRQWNTQKRAWIVAYIYGQDVVDCIKHSYGVKTILPKQQTSVKTEPVVKLMKVEYIGAVKEREDGSMTATGFCAGQWSVIFSLKCLREWFEGNGDKPLNPNVALSLYAILGIKRNATDKKIKKAYRIAAKTWHPDVNNDDTTEQFRRVNKAYEILKDNQQRRKYDAGLYLQAQAEKQPRSNKVLVVASNCWKPPKRCGWVTMLGEETLGRFVVKHILTWEDIVEGGMIMVSYWPKGADVFRLDWI